MKLSICTTIKNRSKVESPYGFLYLFPNCIESLSKCITLNDNIEYIISDWESTDYPIEAWIEEKLPNVDIHILNIIKKDNSISIGKGRNIAADRATGDFILFLDADMLITDPMAFRQAYDMAIKQGNCYPPIMYQKTYGQEHWELHEGGGNLFISKDLYLKTNKWPEYWEHGFEDVEFAKNLKQISSIYTSQLPFFHQWHPQQPDFKNKYSKKDDKVTDLHDIYAKIQQQEIERLKEQLNNRLRDPNTTHSSLKIKKREDRFLL